MCPMLRLCRKAVLVSPPAEGLAGTSAGATAERAIAALERASPSSLPASSPAAPPKEVFLKSHPGLVRAWL